MSDGKITLYLRLEEAEQIFDCLKQRELVRSRLMTTQTAVFLFAACVILRRILVLHITTEGFFYSSTIKAATTRL